MSEITVLTKAASKSKLRTTVPKGIVKQFNLSEGNKLSWEIKAEGSELIIVVRLLKTNRGENKHERKADNIIWRNTQRTQTSNI